MTDGLYRATVIAYRLGLSPRTIRRWLRRGYIEGMIAKASYWVMIRNDRIVILDDAKHRIGDLKM